MDEDNGESALAAVGCITAIRRILEGCESNPQLIQQMENLLYPVLAYSLTPDGLDAIEDTVDCISIIVSSSELVSQQLWKLYPQLLHAVYGESSQNGGHAAEFVI